MQTFNTTTPVVVLRSGLYDGLGILRNLGRLGVRTYVVAPQKRIPAFASRYCAGRFVWDIDRAVPETTLQFLHGVSHSLGGKPVLMYTNDEMMLFVRQYASRLREWFLFPESNADLWWKLYNKREMQFLAQDHGVPVPKSYFPSSRDEILALAEQVTYPLLLKPIHGVLLEKRGGRKMKAHNPDELFRSYTALEESSGPNVMIQEYIPRDDNAYWIFDGYFDNRSKCLTAFTGKKFRQYPPHFGITTYGTTKWNETLAAQSIRFLNAIGYCGVVGMDYCYDIRDGKYKLVDVNIRIAANFRLFVGINGIDVALAQYLDLTGQVVPTTTCPDGRTWLVEDKDLLASFHYLRENQLTFRSWLRSLRGIDELGYFDLHDQKPFWRMVWNHCCRRFSKLLKQENKTSTKPPVWAQKTMLPRTGSAFQDDLHVQPEKTEV